MANLASTYSKQGRWKEVGLGHPASVSGGHAPYNPAGYANSAIPQGSPASYPPAASAIQMPSAPLTSAYSSPPSASYNSRSTVQTQYPSHNTSPTPPPLPAIPGSAGDSPSDDWGSVPSTIIRYASNQRQRSDTASPPAPTTPAHDHSRQNPFSITDYSHISFQATSPGAKFQVRP